MKNLVKIFLCLTLFLFFSVSEDNPELEIDHYVISETSIENANSFETFLKAHYNLISQLKANKNKMSKNGKIKEALKNFYINFLVLSEELNVEKNKRAEFLVDIHSTSFFLVSTCHEQNGQLLEQNLANCSETTETWSEFWDCSAVAFMIYDANEEFVCID